MENKNYLWSKQTLNEEKNWRAEKNTTKYTTLMLGSGKKPQGTFKILRIRI